MPETLLDLLTRRIERTGALTVAEFMAEALHHRGQGYYAGGDPLGATGDFVTAPEISQIFGELLGLWMATIILARGDPDPPCLVELGPGRGTLMADMIRALKTAIPGRDGIQVHLVESNPSLRAAQARVLRGMQPTWHDDLSTLPGQPWYLVANEFFDALPIHQLIWTDGAWRESLVVTDRAGTGLAWGVDRARSSRAALLPDEIRDNPGDGAIAEICPAARAMVAAIAAHVATRGGAALLIDYGGERLATGNSLQAVRDHEPVDVLRDPGLADLSSHVDFSALRHSARAGGAEFHGPVEQGRFLETLGINQRSARLQRSANEMQRQDIENAVHRLIDPEEMGTLFKVAAIVESRASVPVGFD